MKRTLHDVFSEYGALPEYIGIDIDGVNCKSRFGDSFLHSACVRGSLEDVMILLDHGANINSIGEHGFSPLHQAVEHNRFEVVKYLLDHNANKSIKSMDGETPLDLARQWNYSKISNLLGEP